MAGIRLITRHFCWSWDLHYAAAEALHDSIPPRPGWSPEKLSPPAQPRQTLGFRHPTTYGVPAVASLSPGRRDPLSISGDRFEARGSGDPHARASRSGIDL